MGALFNKIKEIIREKLPTNNSGGEVSLCVGESLILIINICEKERVDESLLTQLKRLYLEGTKTEEERNFVKEITQVFLDKNFNVKSDPKTISDDPTRRYFETNLAYHILQNDAQLLDTSQLERFTQNLKKRLFSLPGLDALQRLKVEKILKGNKDEKLLNKYELEYAELIHKLLKQDYHGLSEKACKNLYQIACNTILATLNTQVDKSMPMDIYSDSIFTLGMDGRGRAIKQDHDKVRTTAKGLMQSTSPLPLYNDLVNPVEQDYNSEEFSSFQRSADQAGFMIESGWSQYVFSRQTQPYSNGISSTTLAQIRNIILQKRLGNPYFSSNFQEYMSVFSALMLYNSGGHSFFEIFEVLKLPLCEELLGTNPTLTRALREDSLMYTVLYRDHQKEFESALQATQSYTQILLNKKLLHAQIKKRSEGNKELAFVPGATKDNAAYKLIHHAVLNSSSEEFDALLKNHPEYVTAENGKRWSPLLIAAQLGKTEHVKKLLDAGAHITRRASGFSPLELAIKNQKFATVNLLLEAGAQIKKSKDTKISITRRVPALYLACRQNDMRILNAVLDKGTWSIQDKKEALLVALKIENLEAVRILMKHVTAKEKQKYFSKKYSSSLLQEAVALGNVPLIDHIIKHNIIPFVDINHNKLVQTSAMKGFLPTAKYLLDLANKALDTSINMDTALKAALEHNHFDMAVLLIVYGANPESIPTRGKYLRPFNSYLQQAQHFDFLFTEEEVAKIQQRSAEISHTITDKQNSKLHQFLTNLVGFLNRILPNSLRLGYNDKTHIIQSVTQAFDKKSGQEALRSGVHKLGIFGDSSHKSDKSPEPDQDNSIDKNSP